ncbi:histidine phosphatase family protein [Desulfobacterota bacterium M19]
MILLIRHAEKSLTGNQDITQNGINSALKYGNKLKQEGIQFDEIQVSPVKRCIQTAEKIIDGLQCNINLQKSHLLGDPGIFVSDDQKAAKLFSDFTVCEVINKIITNEALSGFIPIDKACKPLIGEIQKKISSNKSVLYVSHDAIIMPFIAYLNKIKKINKINIVEYLDGYIIKKSHNNFMHLAGELVRFSAFYQRVVPRSKLAG